MLDIQKNLTLKLILLISVIALVTALIIEHVFGHQPCNLCLFERIPYFLAITIIILNYKYRNFEKHFILLLSIIFIFGIMLSLYHLGIEEGFIKESLVCDLKNGLDLISKNEILQQLQQKNISCKDVTFKLFGFSLTSYNILISLLITVSTLKIYFNYEKN